jgi:hypothetical protein
MEYSIKHNESMIKISKSNLSRHLRNYFILVLLPSYLIKYFQDKMLIEYYQQKQFNISCKDGFSKREVQITRCKSKVQIWKECLKEYVHLKKQKELIK